MTVIVKELRDALVEAGASPEKADKAAEAVVAIEQAATKADMAALKADLYRALWVQGIGIIAAVGVLTKLL
jgi:hypothetical protein